MKNKYFIQQRINKWKKSTEIVCSMFSHLVSSVHKDFDEESSLMIVTVYDHNNKQICWAKHNDPLFALAECTKMLNNEDLFISNLMDSLSIK